MKHSSLMFIAHQVKFIQIQCHAPSCPAPDCWAGHSLQSSAGGSQKLPASTVASKSFLVNGAVPVPECCRGHGFRGWICTGCKKNTPPPLQEEMRRTEHWTRMDQVSGGQTNPFSQGSFSKAAFSSDQDLSSSTSAATINPHE